MVPKAVLVAIKKCQHHKVLLKIYRQYYIIILYNTMQGQMILLKDNTGFFVDMQDHLSRATLTAHYHANNTRNF